MKKIIFLTIITSVAVIVNSYSQTGVFFENFESASLPALPAGWTSTAAGGGIGWGTYNGPVRWNTNDIPPHSNYCLINDVLHFYNDPAKLTSPTFSLAGVSNARLSFDCFFNKSWACVSCPIEKAWVELSTDGGATFNLLDSIPATLMWSTLFEDLSASAPSPNCMLRFCYDDQGGTTGGINGIAIDNVKVYGAANYDIGLTVVNPGVGTFENFIEVGNNVMFTGMGANYGLDSFPSYTLTYQVGTSAPVSETFPYGYSPMSSFGFTAYTPYTVTVPGPQVVKVWATVAGDTNLHNDTITTIITGISAANYPVKKLLLEEMTGTWCGWCPRGIVFIDSVYKVDSNIISISSVHARTSDPMANENSSTLSYDLLTLAMDFSGYPSIIIDRRQNNDPYYVFNLVNEYKNFFGFANMSISHSMAGTAVTAKATVQPASDMTGDYRLELIITEQDVSGTSAGFAQDNAYSGYTDTMAGCGYNFNDSTDPVPAGRIQFPFVARWTVPNDLNTEPNGVAGSLPDTMYADSYYYYTFSPVTIPSDWNVAHLGYIVALIDNNPQSPNYGFILNTASTVPPPGLPAMHTGISNQYAETMHLNIFPDPANDEANLSFNLNEAANLELSVYDAPGRKVLSLPVQQMNAGQQLISFSTLSLLPGIYYVTITTEKNRITRVFSVVR